ncbi:MAG: tRNA (adenosine(37)-N6)-threonylcarbamoyltransferase complex ATPase subunit type 1 TsaE [Verrucomicrobiaceae bacterium]|nr:tRNA (adenosine(37)-N6)-threonylcarbamoyltransferase complex ATPase subunit type 1 TsaE [Verrucomicrobiaceae bacterium]
MQPTTVSNEAEMIDAGRAIALGMQASDVIALVGDLGSGKTHFTKGIADGLGCETDITSPTFSLVHEYRGQQLQIFHFDFYRIESAGELIALGWDDYLDAGGICVIEWADRFPELLPASTRWLHLGIQEDQSRLISPMKKP